MIIRRIEVKDTKEVKENGNVTLCLAAFFLSLPWCCITPAALSLLGFLGAVGEARLFVSEITFPLFGISLLLLGRAHYLIHFKKHGGRISRAVVWASTIGALALWAFNFGLTVI
jgi:hypothetical protein